MVQQLNHGGFLWIKGNPGTGKSTLMKLLFEKAKVNTKGDFLQITLSFFFLIQGTVKEKSITGLYHSLLYQIFEKAIDLRDSLE
jgi:ABC-type ATPase involved in cell division